MSISNLLSELRNEQEKYESLIIQQKSIQDFAEYRFVLGKIYGLKAAIDICKNTFEGEPNDQL